jgi:hypothetical protein
MVLPSFLIVPPLLLGSVLTLVRYKVEDPANRLTHPLFLLAAGCWVLVPIYVAVGVAYPRSAMASIAFALGAWILFALAIRASLPAFRKMRERGG